MPIEVERKFRPREDTERRLRALGGRPRGSRSFLDRYFDTEDLRLTCADLWLRARDGRWQLKSPCGAGRPAAGGGGGATRYRETEAEAEILDLLRPHLPGGGGGRGLDALAGAGTGPLREFAAIGTRRTSYGLPGGLRVDLDRADFGHEVGEIEAMVDGEDEVPVALASVEELARSLGVAGEDERPGKMHVFLQNFRPLHYQALRDAGVL